MVVWPVSDSSGHQKKEGEKEVVSWKVVTAKPGVQTYFRFDKSCAASSVVCSSADNWLLLYCVCCSLAISFCARFSSDSDHSTRPLTAQFFSTAAEKATSLAMLARRCFSIAGEICGPS